MKREQIGVEFTGIRTHHRRHGEDTEHTQRKAKILSLSVPLCALSVPAVVKRAEVNSTAHRSN
jgi:hypothetical protein